MGDRLRLVAAVVLVLVGAACIVYAVTAWYRMDHPAGPPNRVAPPSEEPGDVPAEGADRDGGADVPATPDASQSRDPSSVPRGRTPDERRWLWLAAGLPLAAIVLIIVLLIPRWLRPPPMRRTGPSDTADLWQEAGKRLKP